MLLSIFEFWTTVSPHNAFSSPWLHTHPYSESLWCGWCRRVYWQFSPWPKTERQSTATAWKCAENTKSSWKEEKYEKKREKKRTDKNEHGDKQSFESETKENSPLPKKTNKRKSEKAQTKCKHDRETQKNKQKKGKFTRITSTPSTATPLRTSQHIYCRG